jgi:hypothetical protein
VAGLTHSLSVADSATNTGGGGWTLYPLIFNIKTWN